MRMFVNPFFNVYCGVEETFLNALLIFVVEFEAKSPTRFGLKSIRFKCLPIIKV